MQWLHVWSLHNIDFVYYTHLTVATKKSFTIYLINKKDFYVLKKSFWNETILSFCTV